MRHRTQQKRHLLAFLPHSWAAQTFVHTASKDFVVSKPKPNDIFKTSISRHGRKVGPEGLAMGPHSSKSFWICSSPQIWLKRQLLDLEAPLRLPTGAPWKASNKDRELILAKDPNPNHVDVMRLISCCCKVSVVNQGTPVFSAPEQAS